MRLILNRLAVFMSTFRTVKKNKTKTNFFSIILCILLAFFYSFKTNSISFANTNIKEQKDNNLSGFFTSAVVVNSNTGKILYSYNIDRKVYPASLTKMMTAYVVFEAINNGIVGLYDEVSCVKHIRQLNSEVKFTAQQRPTIYDLLLQMIVKSSNNAAILLANEVAGSEENFVKQMNDTAKKMSMNDTKFANPHGLYNEKHTSTARDLVNLSIHLVNDFQHISKLFSITEFMDNENDFIEKTTKIQRNNGEISGSKTGFISASGYNIAVWGNKKGQPIFSIIIGTNSPFERDKLAVSLMNYAVYGTTDDVSLKQQNNDVFLKNLYDFIDFIGLKPEDYGLINNEDNDNILYKKTSQETNNRFLKNNIA